MEKSEFIDIQLWNVLTLHANMSDVLGIVILGRISLEVVTQLTQPLPAALATFSEGACHGGGRGHIPDGSAFGAVPSSPWQTAGESEQRCDATLQDVRRPGGWVHAGKRPTAGASSIPPSIITGSASICIVHLYYYCQMLSSSESETVPHSPLFYPRAWSVDHAQQQSSVKKQQVNRVHEMVPASS